MAVAIATSQWAVCFLLLFLVPLLALDPAKALTSANWEKAKRRGGYQGE